MKERNIVKWVMPAIAVALLGLGGLQVVFLRDSYRQMDEAFTSNALNAMRDVARTLESQEMERKFLSAMADRRRDSLAAVQNAKTQQRTGRSRGQIMIEDDFGLQRGGTPGSPTVSAGAAILSFGDSSDSFFKNDEAPDRPTVDSVFMKDGRIVIRSRASAPKRVPDPAETYFLLRKPRGVLIQEVVASHTHYEERGVGANQSMFMYSTSSESLRVQARQNLAATVFNFTIGNETDSSEFQIRPQLIDSLLKCTLADAGIGIPFAFGVVGGPQNGLTYSSDSKLADELRESPIAAGLFPAGLFSTSGKLVLMFPGRQMFLLQRIAPSVAASVVFLLMIFGSFVITVRALNRQMRFAQRLTDFVNNVTHEFKTPISTISVVTDTLTQPEIIGKEDKVRKYNAIIREEIGRMKSHVDRILQLAVLEEGDVEFKFTPVDAHALIENAVERMKLRVEQRGGKIELALKAANPVVTADEYHLLNVIMNLLDNAEKYSPEIPHIEVKSWNDGGTLRIAVSDHGIGIAKRDLDQIFEKYFRVSTGNRHDVKGFGIGLNYVKLVVDAHKGTVQIESEPSERTTVTVSLPLA
jgi:two-component system phosphate regulon sensor histidine kinase PhoR